MVKENIVVKAYLQNMDPNFDINYHIFKYENIFYYELLSNHYVIYRNQIVAKRYYDKQVNLFYNKYIIININNHRIIGTI